MSVFEAPPAETPRPALTALSLERKQDGGSLRLWAGVTVTVTVHLIPVVVVLFGGFHTKVIPTFEVPSVAVEMVQLQAPPEPPSEQPEGPKQVEAAVAKPQPDKIKLRPVEAVVMADVAPLPLPVSEPLETPHVDSKPALETTAPAARPALSAPVASSAPQSWQAKLLGHLEKHKRYPTAARARRAQGVPYVRFVMDRSGNVLSSRLERGSGHAELDREALALLRRAEPLPGPPEEVTGDTLEFVVPIEFFMRR